MVTVENLKTLNPKHTSWIMRLLPYFEGRSVARIEVAKSVRGRYHDR